MSTLSIQLLCRKSIDFPELAIFASQPGAMINFIGSNYPWLEHFSMDLKMFKPLKFDFQLFVSYIIQIS